MIAALLGIIKTVIIVAIVFFVVTFTVYIFNLDMKLTSALEPFIQSLQEKVKRDRHL